MKFKIKFADQIVGLFILVALVFFAVIVVLIGANQRWFAKDYFFTTVFQSATGAAPGTSIYMKGFTIGKIDTLTLNENNTVDAEFHIYDTYYDKVREYSILELTVSPIGLGSQLLFHPGLGETQLAEGAFIPTADSIEGQTIIEQELVAIPP
ncbi:MAG: MCE family protein, partial [Spirochaetales bacterium]|nr:MCE family protein [Spirochaetales bacterium]